MSHVITTVTSSKSSIGLKHVSETHKLTLDSSVFLVASELSLFRTYYARNWPLLSPSHGFVTLGVAMIVLGLNILGNMNKEATSQQSLGLAFWRLVLASGVLVFVVGFFNIIAVRLYSSSSFYFLIRIRIYHHQLTFLKELRLSRPSSRHYSSSSPISWRRCALRARSCSKGIEHHHPHHWLVVQPAIQLQLAREVTAEALLTSKDFPKCSSITSPILPQLISTSRIPLVFR